MITIQELLYNRGLPLTDKCKLVRHKDTRFDLLALYKNNRKAFYEYQRSQTRDVFRGCDYVVSFLGEENSLARFIGVFHVLGKERRNYTFSIDGIKCECQYLYRLEEVSLFNDMKERTIVKWNNPRCWYQRISNDMEVQEISPGLSYRRFYDFTDIILPFPELCEIINNSYTDWKTALSSVNGVYLITDLGTGKLYVGSAYGEDGIWGRWKEYVTTNGHGNNVSLIKLMESNPDYAVKYFQFSILMLLSKTITSEEAIKKETMFKRKLGSNSFGLNKN